MTSNLKKIIEYSLFIIFLITCLIYFEKLTINLSRLIDTKYLVIILIFSIIAIKYSNIKNIFNIIYKFIIKLNNYNYKHISLLTLICFLLFISSSIILTELNITTNYFQKEKYFVLYAFLKFILFACLFISLISTGFFFCFNLKNEFNTYSSQIVLFLGFGIIILSSISIILGVFSLLYYEIILILISAIILISKKTIDFFLTHKVKSENYKNDFLQNFYLIVFLISFIFLFIRTLLPFREDGDVWGHYLNFYYSVTINNKLFNPDYWMHFAQTKGLGLNFLAISLSDIFSAQLASFIFIMLILFIIYDFGKNFKDNKALLGIISIIICSFGITLDNDINNISLSKGHIQFMALFIFCIWIIFKFFDNKVKIKTILSISIPFFFTGFAHSLFSFTIFLSLSILFLFNLILTKKFNQILFYTLFGLGAGVLTSFILNFIQLGIPEAALTNIFWDYSNQEWFFEKVGLKAITWPLTDTDQIKSLIFEGSINYQEIRNKFNDILFTYSLSLFRSKISLALYIGLIFYLIIDKNYKYLSVLLSIMLCFIISMIIFFIFYSPSFVRSIFFINSILALIFTVSFMMFLKYSSLFVNKSASYLFIFPTLFFLLFFIHKNIYKNQDFYKNLFLKGKSLEYIFLNCEGHHVDCMLFKFLNDINKNYNYSKIYSVSHNPGISSTLPRPGLINEPYFNGIDNFNNLKNLTEEEIVNEFLENGINYLVLDLKRNIENTGKFITKNFIRNHLEVVETKNHIYLLKITNNVEKKDYNFYNLIDLKMSYLINYIFSDQLSHLSSNKPKKEVLNHLKKNTNCLNNYNKSLINKIIKNSEDDNNENDYIEKLKSELLQTISSNYKLDDLKFYNDRGFYWSLTVLGSMTNKLTKIQKFYISKNFTKECIFY
jgi:hypothetical protein